MTDAGREGWFAYFWRENLSNLIIFLFLSAFLCVLSGFGKGRDLLLRFFSVFYLFLCDFVAL